MNFRVLITITSSVRFIFVGCILIFCRTSPVTASYNISASSWNIYNFSATTNQKQQLWRGLKSSLETRTTPPPAAASSPSIEDINDSDSSTKSNSNSNNGVSSNHYYIDSIQSVIIGIVHIFNGFSEFLMQEKDDSNETENDVEDENVENTTIATLWNTNSSTLISSPTPSSSSFLPTSEGTLSSISTSTSSLSFLSDSPSIIPSDFPSRKPSVTPSRTPSLSPSDLPSLFPSDDPSSQPSNTPSESPVSTPSDAPSSQPSDVPSISPSNGPSMFPSDVPSMFPSNVPSFIPSYIPSITSSDIPSLIPSKAPTAVDVSLWIPTNFLPRVSSSGLSADDRSNPTSSLTASEGSAATSSGNQDLILGMSLFAGSVAVIVAIFFYVTKTNQDSSTSSRTDSSVVPLDDDDDDDHDDDQMDLDLNQDNPMIVPTSRYLMNDATDVQTTTQKCRLELISPQQRPEASEYTTRSSTTSPYRRSRSSPTMTSPMHGFSRDVILMSVTSCWRGDFQHRMVNKKNKRSLKIDVENLYSTTTPITPTAENRYPRGVNFATRYTGDKQFEIDEHDDNECTTSIDNDDY